MLPPIIGNINGEILTLYTSPNGNNDGGGGNANGRAARGRYAEIGVRRSEVFLEPFLQQQQQQQPPAAHQQEHHHQQQQPRNGTPLASSPSTPPPEPLQRQLVQLHHAQFQSECSLSSDGSGTSAGGCSSGSATEDDSGGVNGDGLGDASVNGVNGEVACSITLIERLIRSHPIWFLPGIQRAGAFHLLQGKEEGNFVVRQSSQSDTMALSVRLPSGRGPYIEHYLIQASRGKLSLETSENRFDNIPSLIAHYSQCCDELPVQLTLPRAMREAKNRQQLSSLALLGQEFWRYPMANPKPPESAGSSSNTSSLSSFHGGSNNNNNNNINNLGTPSTESIILNLTPISTKDFSNTSPTSTLTTSTFNSTIPRQPRPTPPNTLNLTSFNEPLADAKSGMPKLSPSDKLSQRLISPNLVQNLVRSPSPIVHNVDSNVLSPLNDSKKSCGEFVRGSQFTSSNSSMTSNFHRNIAAGFNELAIRSSPDVVQTPGCHLKSPPPPPPRWAKPGQTPVQTQNNFTVTTTVMFNVNQSGDISTVQSTPSDSNTPSLLSPLGSNQSSNKSSSTPSSSALSPATPILSATSKFLSNGNRTPQVLSPLSNTSKSRKRRERNARKNSQHYQESDIMESYYRSSPADKISDYEDIWNTTDQSNQSSWSPKDCLTKSSNNSDESNKRISMISDAKERILSPVDNRCPADKLIKNEQQQQQQQQMLVQTNEKLIIRNDRASVGEKLSYKEIMSPEFSSFKPPPDAKSLESTPTPEDMAMGKRPDLLSRVCSANSLNSPNTTTPPRNKLGLVVLARSESNSPMTPDSKQSSNSPFYAEPADALPRPQAAGVSIGLVAGRRRPKPLNPSASRFRHSEPANWLHQQLQHQQASGCVLGGGVLHPIDWDETEETEDKTPLISSSVDNLAKRLVGAKEPRRCLPCAAKPVQPPKIKPKIFSDTSWAVDSSWEFIGNDVDDCEPDYDCDINYEADNNDQKFPGEEQNKCIVRKTLTAQSIILQRYPELLKLPETTESVYSDRNSSYDNVERHQDHLQQATMATTTTTSTMTTSLASTTLTEDQRETNCCYEPSESETILDTDDSDAERIRRSRSFRDQLLSPPRLHAMRSRDVAVGGVVGTGSGAGSAIRAYALQLAADRTTTFSQNIENFIQCTKESKEASPHVVMRNMRQFMSGMKNYLVKHGEREFEKEVEKERVKLKANEFLNLDAILESVMMHLVVRPLREHVYRLFVEQYAANGSIQTLAESIQLAQPKHIQDLGVRPKIAPPSEANLERILKYIERLQQADSPLEKLENLLAAISAIFNSVKNANSGRPVTLGADDLLPLLVWILVRGKVVDAEIEAEYMWGLLHPSLLTGEGGYYLTTLSSAVHVLKTFKSSQGTMSTVNGCGTPDCLSVLRVLVPDELHGSLNTRTLPVRPNMNTRDVCRILAHKIRCTNPQDYGLFKLVQGEETLLGDHECPQEMSHCLFAYKRIDAKIAWPRTTSTAIGTCSIIANGSAVAGPAS